MLDERIQEAIFAFEESCHQSGHQLCNRSLSCRKALAALGEDQSAEQRAGRFDVGREVLVRQDKMPEHDWPTATLLGFVHRKILDPPNRRGHWRATAITTALARLAERGFPADCIVRTCIGPSLVRRILLTTSALWVATRSGEVPRDDLPELEAWFILFDAAFEESQETPSLTYVSTVAMSSSIRESADAWIADASITHILGWRRDNYLRVTPESLTLQCGTSGTRWLYERSVLTYPEEWHPESLMWEGAYIADPASVAHSVGEPRAMLSERIVTLHSLLQAQLAAVSGRTEMVLGDMTGTEIYETVVSMLESRMFTAARNVARRAYQERPQDRRLKLIYAFCTIPFNSSEAKHLLLGLGDNPATAMPATIDLATIHVMQGRPAEAIRTLDPFANRFQDEEAWLWDPMSLPDAPTLMYGSTEDWLNRLKRL